jgi:hypothetical protein
MTIGAPAEGINRILYRETCARAEKFGSLWRDNLGGILTLITARQFAGND